MANLKYIDKRELEALFNMGGGYVLDFINSSFETFFRDHSIDIFSEKYSRSSGSKANRLRSFWEQENDPLVGRILKELIEIAEHNNSKTEGKPDKKNIDACKAVVARLLGEKTTAPTKKEFLEIDFSQLKLSALPIEANLIKVLEARIKEMHICLENEAPLSAIFQAGSVLEGVLLGLTTKHPDKFNKANSCPKDRDKKPKEFYKWSLSELIDVSKELGFLGDDVKEFSHILRGFRNYIHPYQQMMSKFSPDLDTAKMCVQAMLAAINDIIESS